MKIGIVGSGHIGATLGKHWASAGHDVLFSSRHPEELRAMADRVGATAGTVKEAAHVGEVILLATPFGKNAEIARQVGALKGKVLIDATNPYPQRDGEVAQRVIDDDALTSTGWTAQQFPEARVVKAFNSIYFKVLENQAFQTGDDRIAVQLVSDDEAAKETVKQLLHNIGMVAHDLGELVNGRYFEPDAPLYNKNLTLPAAQAVYQQAIDRNWSRDQP